MKQKYAQLQEYLANLIKRQKVTPIQFAMELGVSNATICRWLSGKVVPGVKSCKNISEYSGIPLEKVLAMAGYLPKPAILPSSQWPEFREYALIKYRKELDDDFITLVEGMIQKKRQKRHEKHSK